MRAPLTGPLVALLLASACAHGASWHAADLTKLSFDGEDPSMVRAIVKEDTLYMPHPVTRGDSLVGKYGYGAAVAFEEIDHLEAYDSASHGVGTGNAILLTGLGIIAALGVLYGIECAGDDFC